MTPILGSGVSEFVGASFALGLIAVVIIVIAGAIVSSVQAKKARFFDVAVRRLKGTLVPAGLLRPARIEFPLSGREARAEFIAEGEDNQGSTTIRVFLKDSPGKLHIIPDGFGQSFLKMFGAQDLEIGDRKFDIDYIVKATPESFAGWVFSPERRDRVIAAVRRLEKLPTPTVQVTRDQLRVEVQVEILNVDVLLRLVKTAEEFLEFLKVTSPVPGIDLGPLRLAADSACPVCGTTLEQSIVRCEACRTPHHQECWRYVGQCSTYACSSKRCGA